MAEYTIGNRRFDLGEGRPNEGAALVWDESQNAFVLTDDIGLGGDLTVTSPNGNLRRRIGINDLGELVLYPIDAPLLSPAQVTSNTFGLSWTDITDSESSFIIQRATDTAFTLNVVEMQVDANVTSLVDTDGLSAATTYYYRVKAVVGLLDLTEWSNTVTGTTTAGVDPTNFAVARRNRQRYSKVALLAQFDEDSGTDVAGQRHKLRYFRHDALINQRLREDQDIDPLTTTYGPRVAGQATGAAYGTSFNIGTFTTPVYESDWNTPKVKLLDVDDGYLNGDDDPEKWGSGVTVPWEPGYRANDAEVSEATYKDRHMVVVDPAADTLWDMFYVVPTPNLNPPHNYPTPSAGHGGKIPNLSQHGGVFPFPKGATATGFPVNAGLVMFDEVVRGIIPHALKMAVDTTINFRAPATRNDVNAGPNDIPEGAWFRLPYDYDADAAYAGNAKMSDLAKMIAVAFREYGGVVVDRSPGALVLYGEEIRRPPDFTGQYDQWLEYMLDRTPHAFTGNATTDTITSTNHGIANNHHRRIMITSLTGGAGLSLKPTYYFVGNCTANTFQLFTNWSQTQLANFQSDVTAGNFFQVSEGYELFRTDRFPWSQFLLLPPRVAE